MNCRSDRNGLRTCHEKGESFEFLPYVVTPAEAGVQIFGTGDGFWVGLRTDYDTAQAKDALSDVLSRIHRFEPVHV
jgi:hypothetical protein